MINASEIFKTWEEHPTAEGYRLVPEGTKWAKAGGYVHLGDDVSLGDNVSLGDYVRLGAGVSLGDDVSLGDYVSLGAGVRLGAGVSLGDDVSLGNDVRLGAGVSLGDDVSLGAGAVVGANSTEAIDLGFADGYRKTLCCVGGIAYIGAGCRWFTLSEAIKHWGNHSENRKRTLCLLESARALADLEGWKHA